MASFTLLLVIALQVITIREIDGWWHHRNHLNNRNYRRPQGYTLQSLGRKVDDISTKVDALERKQKPIIAFTAYAHTQNNVSPGGVVKFVGTRINEGNAFNTKTSRFTAPVAGLYMFQCAIMTRKGSALEVYLKVNDHFQMLIYPDARAKVGSAWNTASNTVILRLNKGDCVWMEKNKDYGQQPFYVHWAFSSFTGVLLH